MIKVAIVLVPNVALTSVKLREPTTKGEDASVPGNENGVSTIDLAIPDLDISIKLRDDREENKTGYKRGKEASLCPDLVANLLDASFERCDGLSDEDPPKKDVFELDEDEARPHHRHTDVDL